MSAAGRGTGAGIEIGIGQLFLAFAKIGLTSFGGGLSGWMMREFVQSRRWITEAEFLTGLALAQAFPGVNVVNLSIWIGYRLRRGPGALAGAIGIVAPSLVVAIGILAIFDRLARFHPTSVVLAGIGAAAIGLSLQMGARAAWQAGRSPASVAVMIATFLAIFALGLPLPAVVLVMAPLSIAAAARHLAAGR